ncbi:hypothetical protein ACFL27_09140 [candidate division CSSED10-310 bacterium]|uniref:Uncharacterized protein n=1 Tax=candidate division CSSED10-310 bacterium TaxID=2855610 RepID=A0ABV6YVV9_UNCC1
MELVKALTEKALTLKPVDKIQLVEALLSSLDVPNPTIDKI